MRTFTTVEYRSPKSLVWEYRFATNGDLARSKKGRKEHFLRVKWMEWPLLGILLDICPNRFYNCSLMPKPS